MTDEANVVDVEVDVLDDSRVSGRDLGDQLVGEDLDQVVELWEG